MKWSFFTLVVFLLSCSTQHSLTDDSTTLLDINDENVKLIMEEAQYNEDKDLARKVFYSIERSEERGEATESLLKYKKKAQALGHRNVLMRLDESVFHYLADIDINFLLVNTSIDNDQWTTYHITPQMETPIDLTVTLNIDQFDVKLDQVVSRNQVRSFQERVPPRPSQVDSSRTTQSPFRTVTVNDVSQTHHRIIILKGRITLENSRTRSSITAHDIDISSSLRQEIPSYADKANSNVLSSSIGLNDIKVDNNTTAYETLQDQGAGDILRQLSDQLTRFLKKV